MRFSKRKDEPAGIPTGSMADIAFLLILFFMVTTVFRAERGIDAITLPEAEESRKLPNKGIVHIYVYGKMISIDDNQLTIDQVSMYMAKKMQVDPASIVSLRIDEETKYDIVGDLFDQLSEARALRVSLATEKMRG
jgi:biopolymer transport protein ExbD